MNKEQIYDYVEDRLESVDLETLLEDFDITAQEAFYKLYKQGMIDERLIILECE